MLPYAALTDWYLSQRREVFTARYEFRLRLVFYKEEYGVLVECPTFILVYMLLLPEGQAVEIREPPRKEIFLRKSGNIG
jgi:hypothetical protein